MTTTTAAYHVWMPSTPGATETVQAIFASLQEAREYARARGSRRPDLRWQDIAIRTADGKRIAYAGPSR